MWIIATILSAVAHVGYVVFRESADRGGSPIYTSLAETLLRLVFLALFYALWKFYCDQWQRMSNRSTMRLVVEKIWVPFISVFLVTEPHYFLSERHDAGAVVTGVVLFIALMDWGQSIHRVIVSIAERHDAVSNARKLYSCYPPRTRGDLLPMDLFFHIGTIVMLLKKIT